MTAKVSIITPVYNAEAFLAETLESMLAQTFTNWECILVNDCSPDNSLMIAQQYADQDPRFKIINQKKSGGAAKARNAAIEAAQGRYIAFLDSDDLWMPDKLEKQLAFMDEKDVALCFSGYYQMTEDGQRLGEVTVPASVEYDTLLKHNVIGCLTAIYDTEKIGKVFMPDVLKRQDFGLWLKITRMGISAMAIQQPLAEYRLRTNSLSSSKINAVKFTWQLYREVEKQNVIKSTWLILNNVILTILKRVKGRFGGA